MQGASPGPISMVRPSSVKVMTPSMPQMVSSQAS
jgi:hypothetical protein